MGLEVAPFVQDLVVSNPISGDDVNQGDDHIRLLKTTLKATFPTATKAIYSNSSVGQAVSFSVVAADENKTFFIDTTAGPVTVTLPATASAGFQCRFYKYNAGVNPIFMVVSGGAALFSGPLSLTRARRCIPGYYFSAIWSGSNWFVDRVAREPIGSAIACAQAALPAGYEWPNGQTLASVATNYPEYNVAIGSGVTPDMRGRVPAAKDDMGGASANRLTGTSGSLNGDTLLATGGAETHMLVAAEITQHQHSISIQSGGRNVGHTHTFTTSYQSALFGNYQHSHPGSTVAHQLVTSSQQPAFAYNEVVAGTTGLSIANESTDHYHIGTTDGENTDHSHLVSGNTGLIGSSGAHNNVQPTIILNYMLVVE